MLGGRAARIWCAMESKPRRMQSLGSKPQGAWWHHFIDREEGRGRGRWARMDVLP